MTEIENHSDVASVEAGFAGQADADQIWSGRKFVHDALFSYLPGPFQRLRSYLWLVIFSYSLGVSGVGAWALFDMTLSFAVTGATLLMGHAMMRLLSGRRSAEEASAGLSSVLAVVVAAAVVVGLTIGWFSSALARLMFHNAAGRSVIVAVAAVLVFDCVWEELRGFFRARRLNDRWAFLTLARLIPETAIVAVVAFTSRRVDATVWSYVVCATVACAWGLVYVFRGKGLRLVVPDLKLAGQYLAFSLPQMPGTAAAVISARIDRYLVAYFLDLKTVGVYSICSALAGLSSVVAAPIGDVMFPELADLYDKSDRAAFDARFASVQRFILAATIGVAALLCAFPREAIRLVTSADYGSAALSLRLLSGRGILLVAVMFYGLLLNVRFRVWSWTAVYIAMSLCLIAFDLMLIPHFGIAGAAFCQLASTLLGAALVLWLNRDIVGRSFRPIWLLQTVSAFCLLCVFAGVWKTDCLSLSDSARRLAVGLFAYAIALVACGFFNGGEFRVFTSAILSIWRKPPIAA